MKKFCMLNGVLVPEEEATLHSSDLAVRRGFGIFDFFRTSSGQPMYFDRHIRRIMSGAAMAGMEGWITAERIRQEVGELINAHNDHPREGGIRLLLTGGYSAWEPHSPNFIVSYEELKPFDASLYSEGASVITYNHKREIPRIKTISYMTAIHLTPRIKEAGAMEVLYYDDDGVSEFSRSNLFIVKDGELITPDTGILLGVTRGLVLEIARESRNVTECGITLKEVLQADEVFMTSTIKRIIPVVRVDGNAIGSGKPGKVTRLLMEKLSDRDASEAHKGVPG